MNRGRFGACSSDGVIKGVGSVLVFLPQILILFAFIAVLEDCGYMARAAFLMDRLMSRCGLSGKSFIPMLSSVACAVPGIMATRVIENRRDRLATILVAPLMSCSARLPVYIAADRRVPHRGATVLGAGARAVLHVPARVHSRAAGGIVLKRTLLSGETPVFVMEMPLYKRAVAAEYLPAHAGTPDMRSWHRAGKVILAAMIIVWALLYFPNTDANGVSYEELISREAEPSADVKAIQGEWKRNSALGRIGRWMEPAFAPLGWDWKIGTAALASFPAREVIVGMLGMIYDVGDEPDEERLRVTRRGPQGMG